MNETYSWICIYKVFEISYWNHDGFNTKYQITLVQISVESYNKLIIWKTAKEFRNEKQISLRTHGSVHSVEILYFHTHTKLAVLISFLFATELFLVTMKT